MENTNGELSTVIEEGTELYLNCERCAGRGWRFTEAYVKYEQAKNDVILRFKNEDHTYEWFEAKMKRLPSVSAQKQDCGQCGGGGWFPTELGRQILRLILKFEKVSSAGRIAMGLSAKDLASQEP